MFGLSTLGIEAIAAAAVALMIFGGGLKAGYDIEAGKITKLELNYAQAQQKAVQEAQEKQKGLDALATQAASNEALQQAHRADLLAKELANAQTHLSTAKITATCVPYGFLRVLYAGSHGVSTDSLNLPSGKSDDACSPVGWPQLAAEILHNYGQALANGSQLDSLVGLLLKEKK